MTHRDELRAKALAFHKKHPEVWLSFEHFTLERIRQGWQHYSADAVMHRVRWETEARAPRRSETFKISNSHVAFYARAFGRRYPWHKGFFRLRAQPSAVR